MIHFVVALKAEAEPLIRRYDLKRHAGKGLFPVFEKPPYALVISGIGKTNAAAATAYLHQLTGEPARAVWLNVGIAGHPEMEIGRLIVADKIRDAAGGQSWYPPQAVKHRIDTSELITVDRPDDSYNGTAARDMEAAGFYSIASRCSSAELVQCCKVISDNRQAPADQLDRKQVPALIDAALDAIDDFAQSLDALATEIRPVPGLREALDAFTAQWHLTVSQQHQLERLLSLWPVLRPDEPCDPGCFRHCRNGRELLRELSGRIEHASQKMQLHG